LDICHFAKPFYYKKF